VTRRQVSLAIVLLAFVALAHAAARFTQFGGAQFAPSIAAYVLMALLLAPALGWLPLAGLGLATGALTALTTSTTPALPSLLAHAAGFLVASALAKRGSRPGRDFSLGAMLGILAATLVVAWTLFAVSMWLLLAGTPFVAASRERFGVSLGQGFAAWWLFGFLSFGIPTYVISAILLPLLYGSVRAVFTRRGVPVDGDDWLPGRTLER